MDENPYGDEIDEVPQWRDDQFRNESAELAAHSKPPPPKQVVE